MIVAHDSKVCVDKVTFRFESPTNQKTEKTLKPLTIPSIPISELC
jgi:hypothetical protein